MNKWLVFGLGIIAGWLIIRIKTTIESNILYEHIKQMIEDGEMDLNIELLDKDEENKEE